MCFRGTLFALLTLSLMSLNGAFSREPVEIDDGPVWADEEAPPRTSAPPRPIFADEPFFEDDPLESAGVVHVECRADGHSESDGGWFNTGGDRWFNAGGDHWRDDEWTWPDRGRTWTARAGILIMSRTDPHSGILFQNSANPAESTGAGAYKLNAEDGIEASFIYHDALPGCTRPVDLELRFFDLDTEDATQFARLTGMNYQINTRPPTIFGGDADVFSTYSSELTNFEINLRRESENGWWTWICGLRALELDEQLQAVFRDPAAVAGDVSYNVDAENRMFGAQLGGQMAFVRTPRVCVDVFGKAGIMRNQVEHNSVVSGGLLTASDDSNETSFLYEMGITGRYTLTTHWSAYLTYQFLWLQGVALASEQVPVTDFINGTGIDGDTGVLFHGISLGVEMRH